MGAEKQDRIYEELPDMKKLKNILQDVSVYRLACFSLSG